MNEAPCFGMQERFQVRYIEREAHLLIRWGRAQCNEYGVSVPVVLSDMDKRILRYWGIK